MKQIATTTKTFTKEAKRIIAGNIADPFSTISKVGKNRVIRNADGKCVATWHHRVGQNGLIVIH